MRFLVDGRVVDRSAYVVSGLDPGLIAGMNIFETMRTYGGRIFRQHAHLDRLEGSARTLGIAWPGRDLLTRELAAASAGLPPELGVRILITAEGRRLISATPLDMTAIERPLRVATRVWEPPAWLNGRAKHGSRAITEVARADAGTDEIFWVGYDGMLTEGGRSSIFAVIDGVFVTPPDDGRILAGVTRAALLECAKSVGIPAAERAIPLAARFTELYASSTLKELAHVIELDGCPMSGRGPVGAAVVSAFRALVVRECSV